MDTTVDAPGSSSPAVRALSLTKTYGKGEATVQALDGVDIDFEQGRFTAIMGPSGSGNCLCRRP